MKQSGIRIGISRRTGLTALDILRILPGYDVSAEVVLLTADQADGSPEQLGCDAVLLSEQDFDLARELAEKSFTAVLILSEDPGALASACVSEGILLDCPKRLAEALGALLALSVRLRRLRKHTSSLRRKLDDTRFVSRAKLLLMTRLQMSEEEAHHYIEQTAMDSGRKSREVAESIIRAYEE